jgi:hypothetical protein
MTMIGKLTLALISSATALSACVVPAQAQVILGPSSTRWSNGSSYTPSSSYRHGAASDGRSDKQKQLDYVGYRCTQSGNREYFCPVDGAAPLTPSQLNTLDQLQQLRKRQTHYYHNGQYYTR